MANHDVSASLRRLHISSPGASSIYFRHDVGQRPFTHGEMMAILALAGDPKTFGEKLVAMSQKWEPNGFNLASEFVATLGDYTSRIIPEAHIAPILEAFFDVGDELWCQEKEMPRILGFGAYTYIMQVIYQLSRRLTEPDRFEAYRNAFSKGRSLATICREARALAGEHGHGRVGHLIPEEQRQLSPEHEDEIRKVVMRRVRKAAKDSSLLGSGMPAPLYFWEETEGPDPPKAWVSRFVEDDRGLARLLETFLGSLRDMGGERREPSIPLDSLGTFVDPETIIERARKLADAGWLTETQRVAVNQFIKEYDALKSGKDPDSPVEVHRE